MVGPRRSQSKGRSRSSSRSGGISVPERHQLKIAKDTLKMPDAMVGVMGGMNKAEARAILKKHNISYKEYPEPKIKQSLYTIKYTGDSMSPYDVIFAPSGRALGSYRTIDDASREANKKNKKFDTNHKWIGKKVVTYDYNRKPITTNAIIGVDENPSDLRRGYSTVVTSNGYEVTLPKTEFEKMMR